jgi:hypothetical protein
VRDSRKASGTPISSAPITDPIDTTTVPHSASRSAGLATKSRQSPSPRSKLPTMIAAFG